MAVVESQRAPLSRLTPPHTPNTSTHSAASITFDDVRICSARLVWEQGCPLVVQQDVMALERCFFGSERNEFEVVFLHHRVGEHWGTFGFVGSCPTASCCVAASCAGWALKGGPCSSSSLYPESVGLSCGIILL